MSFIHLTEAAQKIVTNLKTKVKVQNDIIKKEREVNSQKGDTYVCTRAKNALESAERKLSTAEIDYETSLAELEKQYKLDKESLLKTHKAYTDKQQSIITQQLQIVNNETNKKTPTIIRCEVEIKSLDDEIKRFLDNDSNYLGGRKNTVTQVPKVSEAPQISDESEISIKEMMEMDRELPKLTFITPSYQYQSERQSKLSGSAREDMPLYGHRLDTTIYGPVSTLPPRPKIPVKMVPKKVINATTNVYPDEVSE